MHWCAALYSVNYKWTSLLSWGETKVCAHVNLYYGFELLNFFMHLSIGFHLAPHKTQTSFIHFLYRLITWFILDRQSQGICIYASITQVFLEQTRAARYFILLSHAFILATSVQRRSKLVLLISPARCIQQEWDGWTITNFRNHPCLLISES